MRDLRPEAAAVVERMGGLEHVAAHELPRAGDPPGPSLWSVYVCPCCCGVVWKSTSPAEADGWKICDFSSWESPFETCNACDAQLSNVAPPLADYLVRSALGHLLLLVRGQMPQTDHDPDPKES